MELVIFFLWNSNLCESWWRLLLYITHVAFVARQRFFLLLSFVLSFYYFKMTCIIRATNRWIIHTYAIKIMQLRFECKKELAKNLPFRSSALQIADVGKSNEMHTAVCFFSAINMCMCMCINMSIIIIIHIGIRCSASFTDCWTGGTPFVYRSTGPCVCVDSSFLFLLLSLQQLLSIDNAFNRL